MRDRRGGFTLVEITVVVAVIAVLVTIGVPFMLEARKTANEKAVVQTMKSIATAQSMFRDGDYDRNGVHEYANSLEKLRGLLDDELLDGERYGYAFILLGANYRFRFRVRAMCLYRGKTGENGYFVDETGIIRVCTDNNADETDPAIP